MAAYVVLNIEVTDPIQYADYIKAAGTTVERCGGKYLARGGRADKLEGSTEPKRFVILEFPSYERAKAWWDCAEYQGPKAIRQSSARSDAILVDGVSS